MYPNINDLFLVTDILITDYSSIPYEFCLLKKPMVFYPYDLEEYKKQRGIIGEYDSLVPGPVVYSTKELVSIINNNEFDLSKVEEFSLKWNQYSKREF